MTEDEKDALVKKLSGLSNSMPELMNNAATSGAKLTMKDLADAAESLGAWRSKTTYVKASSSITAARGTKSQSPNKKVIPIKFTIKEIK